MKCAHPQTTVRGTRPYYAPVFTSGVTEQNRAAHGGCCTTETCNACGASRTVLVNGDAEEHSAWGPPR